MLAVLLICLVAMGAKLSDSVCRVENHFNSFCQSCNRSHDKIGMGSGVLVASQQVLTVNHGFPNGVGQLICQFPNERHNAKVLSQRPDLDLALLGIGPTKLIPMPVAKDMPQRGHTLTLAGFGGEGVYRTISGQMLNYAHVRTTRDGWNHTILTMVGTARQGDSGGPVYNTSKELVAILKGTGSGTTDGIDLREIRKVLSACVGGVCRPQPWRPSMPRAPQPRRPLVPLAPRAESTQLAALTKKVERLEALLVELQRKCQTPAAPGEPGPQGPPGALAEFNVDKIVTEVARRLPPITFRIMVPKGTILPDRGDTEYEVGEESKTHLGETQDYFLVPKGSN